MPGRQLAYAFASLTLLGVMCPAVGATARPNVLIVSLDTLRADAITAMPTLQGLARRGIDFTHALSAAPWTVPSHAALFTGRHPLKLSCKPNKLDIMLGVPNVMTMLDTAGYEVSVMTEMGVLTEDEGYAAGTTHFWTGDRGDAIPALKQWRRRKPQAPWLLVVHTQGAHAPYAPVDIETPARLAELWPPGWTNHWPKIYWEVFRGQLALDPVEARWLRARYRAAAVQTDRELRRVLQLVEPWRENTVVIVTSDHGEELGEYGRWVKHGHNLHDVLLHVPLVVAGPDIVRGEWSPIVSLLDVAPTVLELVGVETPAELDGASLLPILRGKVSKPRRVVSAGVQGNLGTQRISFPNGRVVMSASRCAASMPRAPAAVREGALRRQRGGGAATREGRRPIRPVPARPRPRATSAPAG